MMWIYHDEENLDQLKALLNIYDELDTDEFEDDVKELKKLLKNMVHNHEVVKYF